MIKNDETEAGKIDARGRETVQLNIAEEACNRGPSTGEEILLELQSAKRTGR